MIIGPKQHRPVNDGGTVLSDQDVEGYALLAGRSGGQTLIGGTASGDDLTLQTTSNATKGSIILGSSSAYDEVNDRLGIGTTSPQQSLHIDGSGRFDTGGTQYLLFEPGSPSFGTTVDFSYPADGGLRINPDEGFGHGANLEFVGEDAANSQGQVKIRYGSNNVNIDSTQAIIIEELEGTGGGGSGITERFRIGQDGVIGVNQSSPLSDSMLHITARGSTSNGFTLERNGSSGRMQFSFVDENQSEVWRVGTTAAGGTTFKFFDQTQDAFQIEQNGNVLMTPGGNVGIGTTGPDYLLDVAGEIGGQELSADPTDPDEGEYVMWMSDGTGTGDDGDLLVKITAGSVTKTATLVDFSTL